MREAMQDKREGGINQEKNMSALGVAGLQGGFQIIGNAVNNWFNRRAQAQAFKDNKAMSELAYSQDLDMWNKQSTYNRQMWDLQNEYNLPAAQMQRLRDAGLNPNLMYGNGAAGGQAGKIDQASTPKYSPARADYSHIPFRVPDVIGMYQNFQHKSAQIDLVKEQTKVAREKQLTEAALRAGRITGQTHTNAVKYTEAKYAQAMNQAELERRQQQVKNMLVDFQLKNADLPYRRARAGVKGIEHRWLRDKGIRPQDALWTRLLLGLGGNVLDSNLTKFLLDGENWKSRRIFGDR